MIVVDTSVWIDHLRGHGELPHVRRLRAAFGAEPILVGDLILMEVLQGAQDEPRAAKLERLLRAFYIEPMLNERIALDAARNYRLLAGRGITVRSSIDMIIATFCIEHDYPLLHNDKDYRPIVEHLGLTSVEMLPT